ncbi:MAG: hypothetical protein CBD16_01895 [Betaproteobacteria bacterium TMED156]|nr:MAG: hypothetical protein CBD16_01895 [Betaproteobacteria bacterium TMED156]
MNSKFITDTISETKYTNLAIILHWLLAVLLIFQLCLGTFMVDIPKGPDSTRALWFNFHKSIGIVLVFLIILRVIWRLKNPPPKLSVAIPVWQKMISFLNHLMLYVCMLVMPLTGIIGSLFSKYPIKFFGIPLPRLAPPNEFIKSFTSDLHQLFAVIFIFLIALHILAAIKHLIMDCDGVFERMMPKTKP